MGYGIFILRELSVIPMIFSQSLLFILLGAIIGMIFGIVFYWVRTTYKDIYLEEVKLTIPEFSEMTFKVNNEFRLVAWNLFVETITRIGTQPLDPNTGYLKDALNSLYSLFSTTRELLKQSKPASETNETTVELFAISMLNKVIRPFLSKWYLLLNEFEDAHPEKRENDWEYNQQFRDELDELRIEVLKYARGFGEIAGVEQLDKYFN